MQIYHSDQQQTCRFCGISFQGNIGTSSVLTIDQLNALVPCERCHSLVNIGSDAFTHCQPETQARFHERYFGIDADNDAISRYIEDAKALRNIILHDYAAYFGNKDSDIICEIGSGRGNLLKALTDEGYKVLGCEYSEHLVTTGRKAYGLPEDIFFQLSAWDMPDYLNRKLIRPNILVLWHVIEHIENSMSLIDSLRSACNNNITIIIQTPLAVPEYVFPEHLFFPSTESYHWMAEKFGLSVKLLEVIPYTRFVTCVLSNKNIPLGKIYPKQSDLPGFSIIWQMISQLNQGLIQLDKVTKIQFETITQLKYKLSENSATPHQQLTIVDDLAQITKLLHRVLGSDGNSLSEMKKALQRLSDENTALRQELLRADAQLGLLKDILMQNIDNNHL